jgi:hypothetical protein
MGNMKRIGLERLAGSFFMGLLCFLLLVGCSSWRKGNAPPPNPIGQTSELPPSSSSPPPPPPSSMGMASRTMTFDFPDVPVPQELSRSDGDSFVFQAGQLNVGLMALKGMRVDVGSLVNFYKAAMPRENWKSRGGFHAKRTVLIFEKPDKTCVINIFEKMLYTYVEVYLAPMSGGV